MDRAVIKKTIGQKYLTHIRSKYLMVNLPRLDTRWLMANLRSKPLTMYCVAQWWECHHPCHWFDKKNTTVARFGRGLINNFVTICISKVGEQKSRGRIENVKIVVEK